MIGTLGGLDRFRAAGICDSILTSRHCGQSSPRRSDNAFE